MKVLFYNIYIMFNAKDYTEIVRLIGAKSRLAGSKGENDSFDFIKKYIKDKIGGKTIFQNYKILTWKEIEKSGITIEGREIDSRAFYYSPSSKIKGKLEYFGENENEKGNEFSVFCIRDGRKNIKAFINLSKKFKKPFYYSNGETSYLLPNIIIGSDSKNLFEDSIGKQIEIKVRSKFVIKNSLNLIHKLSDRKNKFKLLIVSHVDTVPHSKGIIDDASGVGASLLLSQELRKMKLPFDVWMIYFGAEENSMFGSKFFVDTLNAKEKEKIKYVISIDGIGMGEKTSVFVETDYNSQIFKAFENIKDKLVLENIEKSFDSSDHYYFKLCGIDSCLIEGNIENFYYHESEANDLANLNSDLCVETMEGIMKYIKNIEFKSPDVSFSTKKANFIQKLLGIK